MTSSHPSYPHQGQAPNYYQPSPPPTHAYGTHSPAPIPSPAYQYQYPAPPPPHMATHHPVHQPVQSRMNSRAQPFTPMAARAHGGYPAYHHHQHTHHHQHQPYSPILHTPHPQHPSHLHALYPPHKYPQHYSPSYPYPPAATTPTYSPSWQAQPLSPLPKHLPVSTPRGVSPAYYEHPPAPPPVVLQAPPPPTLPQTQTIPPVVITPEESSPAPLEEKTLERIQEDPQDTAPAESPKSPTATPEPIRFRSQSPVHATPQPAPPILSTTAPIFASSSYFEIGTVPPPESETYKAQFEESSSTPLIIWSRRPTDPSHAPGIIISSRARPPPKVVKQASDLRTPPPSPPLPSSIELSQPEASISTDLGSDSTSTGTGSATNSQFPPVTTITVSSSSVTETTNTPNAPGSPASPATPVSQVKDGEVISVAAAPIALDPPTVAVTVKVPTSASAKQFAERSGRVDSTVTGAAAPATTTAPAFGSLPAASASTVTPSTVVAPDIAPPATPTPVVPQVKKSWASLLRSSQPSSGAPGGTPAKNALPMSQVVGFSIPALSPSSTPAPSSAPSGAQPPTTSTNTYGIHPAKRADLLNLLTSNPPAPPTSAAAALAAGTQQQQAAQGQVHNIKPRGLINSGNMCFANAVLQILIYCPPFNQLFWELGRVLGAQGGQGIIGGSSGAVKMGRPNKGVSFGTAAGSGSTVNEKDAGLGASSGSSTALVDATIEFLREFIDGSKKKSRNNRRSNGVSIAGPSGRGNKGKERMSAEEMGDDGDDLAGESFLPTHVYEAMREKKRFDSMKLGQQEDAEEFLGFYLDTLEEELLAILSAVSPPPAVPSSAKSTTSGSTTTSPVTLTKKLPLTEEREEVAKPEEGWMEVGRKNRMVVTRTVRATESPITRIFGGKFRSTLKVPHQKDSVLIEDWRSLPLDIQHDQITTIQEALSFISQPQPVQLRATSSTLPAVEGSQQVLIESLPAILILHLKRFHYDVELGMSVKVGKQVRFGPELEIGGDLMALTAKRTLSARYKLFGALYHHGVSASGGHYTLDVLHPNRYPVPPVNSSSSPSPAAQKMREGWVRIDDEFVSDMRVDDVFGPQAFERDENRCAYLLFYRRIR